MLMKEQNKIHVTTLLISSHVCCVTSPSSSCTRTFMQIDFSSHVVVVDVFLFNFCCLMVTMVGTFTTLVINFVIFYLSIFFYAL